MGEQRQPEPRDASAPPEGERSLLYERRDLSARKRDPALYTQAAFILSGWFAVQLLVLLSTRMIHSPGQLGEVDVLVLIMASVGAIFAVGVLWDAFTDADKSVRNKAPVLIAWASVALIVATASLTLFM